MKVWLLFLLVFCSLWHCSDADTLADEPPVEVPITGIPTYQNGIRELLDLKCGYCHAVPRPEIAPDTVPPDLDLTVYATQVVDGKVIRGADSIGRYIFDGILAGEVQQYLDSFEPKTTDKLRQMPLDYGTQLTPREVANLELWSNNGSPFDETPEPNDGDPTVGSRIWFQNGCAGCHDLGNGVEFDGKVVGPPVRPESLTIAKIKMMYLHRVRPEAITDEEASGVRAFLMPFLEDN